MALNNPDTASASLQSTNQVKRQRLVASWPAPMARHIPEWIPYHILRIADSIAIKATTVLICVLFIGHNIFSNTDIWGARRDRSEERRRAREWKQYNQEEVSWKPTPLELPRKRRLRLPLEPMIVEKRGWWIWKNHEAQQQSFDQLQSPLGRLPEELRAIVYAHLVTGRRLHIQESYKRFGFVECASNDYPGETTTCKQVFGCLEPYLNKVRGLGNYTPSTGSRLYLSSYQGFRMKPKSVKGINDIPCPRDELLAVAKTCRLLYTGYISSLYSLTTFAFTSLKQFQTFATTIPPHYLNKITSFQLYSEIGSSFRDRLDVGWEDRPTSQWKRAWEIIANMQRLRILRVDLRLERLHRGPETSSSGVHRWMEHRIFGPMQGVRQTCVFEVSVNWVESQGFLLEDPVFTLERESGSVAWSDSIAGRFN
jgi:hypothetical protein